MDLDVSVDMGMEQGIWNGGGATCAPLITSSTQLERCEALKT